MAIKLAIVGSGEITKESHLPAVLRNTDFHLTALVDTDPETARRLLKTFGLDTPVYDNVANIPPVDASIVAVPPHLHAEVSIELMEKGVHVLCEKPIATNTGDGEKMMKEAASRKVVLLIGINRFFYPNTGIMLDILKDGVLGELETIRLINGVRSEWDATNPRRFDPEYVPGGVLFENGVHWLYRLIHWFGYPELSRFEDDRIDGVEANARIACVFTALGQRIDCSMVFSYTHPLKNRFLVQGTKASAEIFENDNQSVYIKQTIGGSPKILEVKNFDANPSLNDFDEQLICFADLIRHNHIGPIQTKYALDALTFMEECYKNRVSIHQPWVFAGIKDNGRES